MLLLLLFEVNRGLFEVNRGLSVIFDGWLFGAAHLYFESEPYGPDGSRGGSKDGHHHGPSRQGRRRSRHLWWYVETSTSTSTRGRLESNAHTNWRTSPFAQSSYFTSSFPSHVDIDTDALQNLSSSAKSSRTSSSPPPGSSSSDLYKKTNQPVAFIADSSIYLSMRVSLCMIAN